MVAILKRNSTLSVSGFGGIGCTVGGVNDPSVSSGSSSRLYGTSEQHSRCEKPLFTELLGFSKLRFNSEPDLILFLSLSRRLNRESALAACVPRPTGLTESNEAFRGIAYFSWNSQEPISREVFVRLSLLGREIFFRRDFSSNFLDRRSLLALTSRDRSWCSWSRLVWGSVAEKKFNFSFHKIPQFQN